MTLIHGQLNRCRHWGLKVIAAAWLSGVLGSMPFVYTNYLKPGCTPMDVTTILMSGPMFALPALVGFALGRFWLVAMTSWAVIYWQQIGYLFQGLTGSTIDMAIGLMAATLLAGSMSFLCHVLKLRTFETLQQDPKVTSIPIALGKFRR